MKVRFGGRIRAVFLSALCCLVLATRTFVAADHIRVKVVQAPVAAFAGTVHASTPDERVNALRPPFALIARIRHDSTSKQAFTIGVDGRTVCYAVLTGPVTRRIDCAVAAGWDRRSQHEISIEGPSTPWSLQYLELATHHGYATGVVNLYLMPAASTGYARPGALLVLLACLAVTGLLLLPRFPATSRSAALVEGALTGLVITFFTLVLITPIVSPYRLVLSMWTGVAWSCLFQSRVLGSWARRAAVSVANVGRIKERHLAWALSLAVCVLGITRGSRAVGAADTYGYVSEADLWLHGHLKIDQSFAKQVPWPQSAWTFAPLGYRPHPPDDRLIVPSYSPGLPMLLALSKRLAGHTAMFFVVPASAGLFVLATYAVGRRLGSGMAGLIAAWLVATSPVVLGHTMSAMTDVPVAAAWAGAFYLLLGTSVRSAAGAGLLSSAATLIRPNLAPLTVVFALHYVLSMRHADRRRQSAWLLLMFILAALPGPVAVAAINQHLFGSPFESGYGNLVDLFAWNRVPRNLRNYLTWLVEAHTPVVLLGVAAIFVPLRRLWPWITDRAVFLVIDAFVVMLWMIYCAWVVFDTWWFTRFLLSSWPFIMLGLGAVGAAAWHMHHRVRPAVVCAAIVLGCVQLRFAADRNIFDFGRGERRYVAVARLTQQVTEPNSVTISMIHSGSLRYYGGRMTLNYAWLDGNWLDRAVDWLGSRGVHTYAVLDDWEVAEFRSRFAGADRLAVLDRPPLAVYLDPGKTVIFDLSQPPARSSNPVVASGIDASWYAVPPTSPPRLVFTAGQ